MTESGYRNERSPARDPAESSEGATTLGEVVELRPPPKWRARRRSYEPEPAAKRFAQVHSLIIRDHRLTLAARVVYAELASYAWIPDRRGLIGWVRGVALEQIASNVGLSPRTVRTAVGALEELGWVQREDARGPAATLVYRLPLLAARNGLEF